MSRSSAAAVAVDVAVRNHACRPAGRFYRWEARSISAPHSAGVLGDFRTTYVLYCTPRGVETGGYHTIEVRTGREGTQVQARRGYFGS